MNNLCQNCQNINEIIDILKHNGWDIAGTVSSFMVVLVALIVGFREDIKGWLYKSNVYPFEKQYNFKQDGVLVTRFKVINNGRAVAKNTTFVVEELFYGEKEDEEHRAKNFLSYPLSWTHRKTDLIDLYKNRPYFLDFCEVVIKENRVRLHSPVGDPLKDSGLDDIKSGNNILKISMYCDNQKRKEYKVYIYWSGDEYDFIQIKKFVRIKECKK